MQTNTRHHAQHHTPHHTQVLVVGGSLVGLSAALFLAARGVRTLLVEKHRGSAPHPRAIGFTELTLEHYRAVGIADRIPQVSADVRLRRAKVESLTGTWYEETPWTPGQAELDKGVASPCTGAAIAQDVLEPILRTTAVERGADLRQGVELLAFAQTPDRVTARVRHRDGGEAYDVDADYLVAADGADSPVREQLGIARAGVGHLRTIRSVLFRCDAAEPYLAAGVQQFEIEQPGFQAFLTHYPDGRWVLMFGDDAERSEAELREAIRRALGRDLPVELVTTGRWEMAGRVAERYRAGRVFLAGDAAHQTPPFFGQGMCHGMRDAANLAWKLGMVVRGTANEELLDSYQPERDPQVRSVVSAAVAAGRYICELDTDAAHARDRVMRARAATGEARTAADLVPPYHAGIVLAGSAGAGERFVQPWLATATGPRLLDDVTGGGWRLFVTEDALQAPALDLAPLRIRPIDVASVPDDGTLRRWLDQRGARAVLVRPDAYVFGTAADGVAPLLDALRDALGLMPAMALQEGN